MKWLVNDFSSLGRQPVAWGLQMRRRYARTRAACSKLGLHPGHCSKGRKEQKCPNQDKQVITGSLFQDHCLNQFLLLPFSAAFSCPVVSYVILLIFVHFYISLSVTQHLYFLLYFLYIAKEFLFTYHYFLLGFCYHLLFILVFPFGGLVRKEILSWLLFIYFESSLCHWVM